MRIPLMMMVGVLTVGTATAQSTTDDQATQASPSDAVATQTTPVEPIAPVTSEPTSPVAQQEQITQPEATTTTAPTTASTPTQPITDTPSQTSDPAVAPAPASTSPAPIAIAPKAVPQVEPRAKPVNAPVAPKAPAAPADRPASIAQINNSAAQGATSAKPEAVALAVLRELNAHQIALADLALAKAPNAEIKRYAKMLREDYQANQNQLAAVVAENHLALTFPAAEIKADYAAERKALAATSGKNFERAFWAAMEKSQSDVMARLDTLMLPIVTDRDVYDYLLLTRVQAGMQMVEAQRQINVQALSMR